MQLVSRSLCCWQSTRALLPHGMAQRGLWWAAAMRPPAAVATRRLPAEHVWRQQQQQLWRLLTVLMVSRLSSRQGQLQERWLHHAA